MTWICERCRCTYESSFPDKIETIRDNDLIEHSVPSDSALCFSCALYLLWSRVFQGGIRRFWDEYYKADKKIILGQKSRYNYYCRDFDIRYRFLNPGTNLYWDE